MSRATKLEQALHEAERAYEEARRRTLHTSSPVSFNGSSTALIELERARDRLNTLRRAAGKPTLDEERDARHREQVRAHTARQRARHERRQREAKEQRQ